MRPKGSPAELEVRRRIAGQLLLEGKGISEVARIVKASKSSVKEWRDAVVRKGLDGLKAKPHPGAKPRLNRAQKKQFVRILLRGPLAAGYSTDLWTCPRVAEVIERKLGVKYHPAHVWKLLRNLGWTCQGPEQRARERDEAAVAAFRRDDWPRIKKGGRKSKLSSRCWTKVGS